MGQNDAQMINYVSERLAKAETGMKDAFYDLGLLYSTGQGVERDFVEAHKWFNLAAMNGLRRAEVDRSELARDMTKRDINTALKRARDWISSH